MKSIALSALLFSAFLSSAAVAETCVGPAPCDWTPSTDASEPPDADELCLGGNIGCISVAYSKIDDDDGGWYAMARSNVDGFPIAALSGICKPTWDCPALYSEVKRKLSVEALGVGRVQRSDSE